MADMYSVSPVLSNSFEMRRVGGFTVPVVATATGANNFGPCSGFFTVSAPVGRAGILAAFDLIFGAAATRTAAAVLVVVLRDEARVTGFVGFAWIRVVFWEGNY